MNDPFGLLSKNWLVWRIGRRHIASVAHLTKGELLDIGCGEQPMRPLFERRVDKIWGIDHFRTLHKNEKIEVFGTALQLPFKNDQFDSAVCLQVLEHVPEPVELLREACRTLKPGAHLILTAPHIWALHEEPHDYFRYTSHGLRFILEKAGFEVIEIRPMAGYFVTAAARFCYFLEHFDRFVLKILVKPSYFIVQCLGWLLDRIYCDTKETWNYLAVARVPEKRTDEAR